MFVDSCLFKNIVREIMISYSTKDRRLYIVVDARLMLLLC